MTHTTIPTAVHRDGRPRRRRTVGALASGLLAAAVLAAPAFLPSSSSADDLAFPYVDRFDSAAGGTLSGDAHVVDGRLRLTDQTNDQAGAWSTDDTFRSDLGLDIEFDYAMYNDVGDQGADGLLLFLADGSAAQGVGSFGAGLGYACRTEATQGGGAHCDLPGVPGGFAAVAVDHYGNFSQRINGSGLGRRPDSVVVRGSGDGTDGYRYVDGAPAPGGTTTDGPTMRKVRVSLVPGQVGELFLTVRLEDGGVLRTVLDRVPLHGDSQAPLPDTLRLGFAAATGSFVDRHEVDDLRVSQPVDLAVAQEAPALATPGHPFAYTVTATDAGPNRSDPSALQVDVPDGLRDVSWTCTATSGSTCGTTSGTGDVDEGLDLAAGGSATVTVTGTVADDATGTLDSTATITPPASLSDVDESDNRSAVSSPVGAAPDPEAQLETDKSASPSTGVAPGDEVEYLVTARNRGPDAAQDVGVVDDLPPAMSFVGSDDGCTADGQYVTCRSDEPLAVGERRSFRIRAVLDPDYAGDGSDVVNVATATSPTDPDGGDPSPEVIIGVTVPDDGSDGGDHDGAGERPSPTPVPTSDPTGTASGRPTPVPAAAGRPAGDQGRGPHALAWTGAEGLGLLGGVAAGAIGLGAAGRWLARRRTTADHEG
ncbi:hypothetical protein DEJ23_13585 [Curtobacterium sp. MCSS17_008]|uniref:lectin-like domain-containing protein n=1 Tax=Curtobacterium sp. MCSS17_008 TaxID=2175647 RepID=UPI000DA90893|nr:DUF11 domain-containing protein [Curtobacterium sp. MCSS17_008]PZF54160.1 hypothetical protein DEJ23_13585 [Curtobacterium sp. MCSS17_008]